MNANIRYFGGVGLLVVGFMLGEKKNPDGSEVRAQSFVLEDASGRERARWTCEDGQALFELQSSDDKSLLRLLVRPEGGAEISIGTVDGQVYDRAVSIAVRTDADLLSDYGFDPSEFDPSAEFDASEVIPFRSYFLLSDPQQDAWINIALDTWGNPEIVMRAASGDGYRRIGMRRE